ncbi:MAG TPA: ribonuclease P protein component [Solimonas sp.]|nr:ribonuclease P protein component [Solimonas sp.]
MARLRFDRRARLRKPRDFEAAFERGSRFNEKWLAALVTPNAPAGPRLGLAVAKKTAARANTRNRIKRQIRESFRQNRHRLPPSDIVILARPGCPQATAPQLREVLERLWQRIIRAPASSPPPASA